MLHHFLGRFAAFVWSVALVAGPAVTAAAEGSSNDTETGAEARPPTRELAVLAASDPSLVGPIIQPEDNLPSRVLAIVGGEEITLGHVLVEIMAEDVMAQLGQLPLEKVFAEVFSTLVEDAALAASLKEVPLSLQMHEDNLRRFRLATHHAGLVQQSHTANEGQIKAAYDAEYAEMAPEKEYNASHILVERLEEAVAIISDLSNGAEFETLAQEHSIGPSGPSGGSLGWFGPGRMVPAFEKAVSMLEPGQTSPPIETEFGWHVIQLNDARIPNVPTYEEIRETLKEQIEKEAYHKALSDLISSVPTEINDLDRIDFSILQDPLRAFEQDDDEIALGADTGD